MSPIRSHRVTTFFAVGFLAVGAIVSPASGQSPPPATGTAGAPQQADTPADARPRPRTILIRVTGDTLGFEAEITIMGVKGSAAGTSRTFPVSRRLALARLPLGVYRVTAAPIVAGENAVAPIISRPRLTLTKARGAIVAVHYTRRARFTTLSAGPGHTCGIDDAGRAWCWGHNYSGQVGEATGSDAVTSPVAVAGDRTFTTVAAGVNHTCALDPSRKAWCWGNNDGGELGHGRPTGVDRSAPVPVAGSHNFVSITAGGLELGHTCAIDTDGKAWCWGYDGAGQLGDGDNQSRWTCGTANHCAFAPVRVAGRRTYTALSAGADHTCGIDSTGKARCWGSDAYGTLGNGEDRGGNHVEAVYAPVAVAGHRRYVSISAGVVNTCAVDVRGRMYCWGSDGFGQIGDGDEGRFGSLDDGDQFSPVAVKGRHTFTAVASGSSHTCGTDTAARVWCWGNDSNGEVGNGWDARARGRCLYGRTRCHYSPVKVSSSVRSTAITVGWDASCGLDTIGRAWCWGSDAFGQIGNGPEQAKNQDVPSAVAGGHIWRQPW